MKAILLVCLPLVVAVSTAFADNKSSNDQMVANSPISAESVAEIRIQAIARALADLKMQEVALRETPPVDSAKLGVVLAQQRTLKQEILQIRIEALQERQQILSDKYLPGYPLMKQLQVEIDVCKEELKKSA